MRNVQRTQAPRQEEYVKSIKEAILDYILIDIHKTIKDLANRKARRVETIYFKYAYIHSHTLQTLVVFLKIAYVLVISVLLKRGTAK